MAHILPRIALSIAKKERPKDSSDEREKHPTIWFGMEDDHLRKHT
jgi:hypothetical protein